MHRRTLALVIALAFAGSCFGNANAVSPATGLDKLSVYAGSWNIASEYFNTPYTKAHKEQSVVRNNCWRSRNYFACNQVSGTELETFIVYTYDPKAAVYHVYTIHDHLHRVSMGTLVINGKTWTYSAKLKDQNNKDVDIVNVNSVTSSDTIDYLEKFSNDSQHWTLMSKGHEVKLHASDK